MPVFQQNYTHQFRSLDNNTYTTYTNIQFKLDVRTILHLHNDTKKAHISRHTNIYICFLQ
jgi:hypothetical protein